MTLRLTFAHDFPQRFPVVRELRHGFTIVPRLAGPVVNGQREVVGGDRASDRVAQGLDSLDGGARRRVLEHDAQPGEPGVQFDEVREEGGFGVDDVDVLFVRILM